MLDPDTRVKMRIRKGQNQNALRLPDGGATETSAIAAN
jgi:hypothetical protein